ncbi:hypothetical protein GOBAR_AA24439 [Gossypium barbadense]|uniref:DUF632 domain-containing protein n=1 Tax=Gossypium barbadense TaxID=3634 RepID=A0A2P5WYR6_GOSBA|nr:hypothetical protein GOBAR_AA24439 [Gossypium barbadense]
MGEGFMDIDKIEQEKDLKLKAYSRYRVLCSTFVKIAMMACESKASSKLAFKYTDELLPKLREISMEQVQGIEGKTKHAL